MQETIDILNGADNRRLVAVLFADMAGFSRLRQAVALKLRDEMLALARRALACHRGRIVNTMGDGFLAELPTARDAVCCSLSLQETINKRNAGQGRQRRFRLRVGLHLGEVVVEADGNLLGDNVNLAKRAEMLAMPGGINVTEQFWQQLEVPFQRRFRRAGYIAVKHIRQRVCFYDWPAPEASWLDRMLHRGRIRFARLGRQVVFGMACVLFVLAALALWPLAEAWIFATPEQLVARGMRLLERHYHEGNIDKAENCFTKAIKADAAFYPARAGLAWAFWLRYQEMPEPATLEDAKTQANLAVVANPRFGLSYRVLGLVAKKEGDLLGASNQLFQANVSSQWLDGYSRAWFARVQWELGETNEAQKNLDFAYGLGSTNWSVLAVLGAHALERLDLTNAQNALQPAVSYNSDNPVALRDLAILRVYQKQPSDALSLAKRSLAKRRSAETLSVVASCLLALDNSRRSRYEALAYYLEAVTNCPNNYLFHLRAANLLLGLPGRNEDARKEYEQATLQIAGQLRNPTNQPVVLVHRGSCAAGLRKTEAALNDFHLAEQIAPANIRVLEALVQGYRILRDTNNAVRMETAIDQLWQKR